MTTTVRQAFDSMGFTLKEGETVCVSFGEEHFREYSLHEVADRELGANTYFSTGTFPVGTVWRRNNRPVKGARDFKNVLRILELPFDFDLKDFLGQSKDDIYELSDDELAGYMPLLQSAVEDVFARLALPIHRLDCTGYGLSAHVVIPDHQQEHTSQIRAWHAAIVTRINAMFGSILADPQVKDPGSRIMRLIPCTNVGTRKDGSRVQPRHSYNVYRKAGFIDQAKLETAAGALTWTPSTVDIPLTGEVLSPEQMQRIIDVYAPYHVRGQKHFMALAVAGQLAKSRIPEDQALQIVTAISAEDQKPWDRQKAVRDTYERVRNGQDIAGYSALRQMVDEPAIEHVDTMLAAVRKAQQPNLILLSDHKPTGASSGDDVKLFNPPPVPQAAFYGWHREWLDLVYPTTAAAEAFHLAASTTFQAAMMGRRISVEYAGGRIFPNQYTLVVGRTGSSFKDTGHNRTIDMLNNARDASAGSQMLRRDEFVVVRDFASREALIDTLITTPNVYLFSSEITTLFKNTTRESTGTALLDALINAWDNPPELSTNSMRARTENRGTAKEPYLNIYGGTQPNRIGEYMTETMISSGLGNRLGIFMGQSRGRLARTPKLDYRESVRMYKRMQAAIQHYPEGNELAMNDAACQRWDDWFYALPEETDELAADMRVRHPVMVQKWALMFAVADQADCIDLPHLDAAIALIEWMWECIAMFLPSWGVSNERKIEERIITVLQQRQPMSKRDLNRYVRGKWTAREFATVFKAMKENDQIAIDATGRFVALAEHVLMERGIA